MHKGNRLLPVLLGVVVLGLSACSYEVRIEVTPGDARVLVDGNEVEPGTSLRLKARQFSVQASRTGFVPLTEARRRTALWGPEILTLSLVPETYAVDLGSLQGGRLIGIDGASGLPEPVTASLSYGAHRVSLAAIGGGPAVDLAIWVAGPGAYRLRPLGGLPPGLESLGAYPCGAAPKQVTFSPDGKNLFVALLSGPGFDVIDWAERKRTRIEVPGYAKDEGFVEGLFPGTTGTFLVSQMTRNAAHEFALHPGEPPRYQRTIPSLGDWTKVLAFEPRGRLLALSNWVSSDVTILDYPSGNLRKRLPKLGTPRGLAFSPSGDRLYVASFGTGVLRSFDTATWREVARLDRPGGALRHLVLGPGGRLLYASDMARNEVLEVEAATLAVLHVYPTDDNPNTIDLDPTGRLLGISCRGPNNPESYILRSPAPGSVLLYDTRSRTLAARVQGGAQPTGLDISPDGNFLAFTNFQDHSVEVYRIAGLRDALEGKAGTGAGSGQGPQPPSSP